MTSLNIDDFFNIQDTQRQKEKLIELFGLNDANANYFLSILMQINSPKANYSIVEDLKLNGFFPLSLADEQLLKSHNIYSYKVVQSKALNKFSESIYFMPLMAGIGSSIKRFSHLQAHTNRTQLGTKSTDLFVNSAKKSIFELLVEQVEIINSDPAREIIFNPQTSEDTFNLVTDLLEKKPLSFKAFANPEIIQNKLPTLMGKNLVNKQVAPGGHGYFAYYWIDNILKNSTKGISIIGNGEDLNSLPPLEIVDWFSEQNFPILMITTTKTTIDKKGGQICLLNDSDQTYLSIIEKAQAEQCSQLQLFYDIGLRPKDGPSFFNTNTVLINNSLLRRKLKSIQTSDNPLQLQSLLSPQLIKNKKKNSNSEEYTQLEGAMGSVVLNLNQKFQCITGNSLLGILNLDPSDRFKVFCPIKTAFDFVHKYYSDRFVINHSRLNDNNPGLQTEISLKDSSGVIDYDDVDQCIRSFSNTSLKDLSSLFVDGPINFQDLVLKGSIKVSNSTGQIIMLKEKLFDSGHGEILSDCEIEIHADKLILKKITQNKNEAL